MTDTNLSNSASIEDFTNSVKEMSEEELKASTAKELKKLKTYLQFLKMKNSKMHLIPFQRNQRKIRRDNRRAFAAGNKRVFN